MIDAMLKTSIDDTRTRRRSSTNGSGVSPRIKRAFHPGKPLSNTEYHTLTKVPNSTIELPLPLSRQALLQRLNTFSPLSWSVSDSVLSPLVCAVQGWKCNETYGSEIRKNELHCVGCHALLMVKLPHLRYEDSSIDVSDDELGVSIGYGAVENLFLNNEEVALYLDDDTSDLMSLSEDHKSASSFHQVLVNSYTRRLQSEHYASCPFAPLLPLKPEDQDYYIRPKDIPREIKEFNSRIDTLNKNWDLIKDINFQKQQIFSQDNLSWLKEYSKSRNYYDQALLIGILGWSLKVQRFHKDVILLLRCDYCCRRVLLSTSINEKNKIEQLPPCPYPAAVSNVDTEMGYGEGGVWEQEEDTDFDENAIDLFDEHEKWCCMRQGCQSVLIGLKANFQNL